MSDETMTFPEVLRAMAENVEAGRKAVDGFETKVDGRWVKAHEVNNLAVDAALGNVRRKPRTIEVAGIQVPEPMRESPVIGTKYWYVGADGDVEAEYWESCALDYEALYFGNVFATEEGAKARAEAERRLFGVDQTATNE